MTAMPTTARAMETHSDLGRSSASRNSSDSTNRCAREPRPMYAIDAAKAINNTAPDHRGVMDPTSARPAITGANSNSATTPRGRLISSGAISAPRPSAMHTMNVAPPYAVPSAISA